MHNTFISRTLDDGKEEPEEPTKCYVKSRGGIFRGISFPKLSGRWRSRLSPRIFSHMKWSRN